MADGSPPAAVSDCVGNGGPAYTLRWREREYPVAYPTPAALARIEKLVVRRAKDALDAVREAYTPGEWAAEQDALRAAVRAREFAPGGSLWVAEMRADGGERAVRFVLWSCLPPDLTFDAVTDLFAEEPDEALLAAACVLPDFTTRVAEAQRVPTTTRTALRARAEAEAAKLRAA